jgi:erythromycin esterase-like protein
MADNALWALKNFGAGRGIALWAHNLHVANDFNDAWPESTGYHLRRQLGRQYVAVGFSFCQGTFAAWGYDPATQTYSGLQIFTIDTLPLESSVNDLFFNAEKKMFFLRLDRLAPGDPLQAWFGQDRRMLRIGAAYDGDPAGDYGAPFSVPLHYDVLVHFDRTTHAVQLEE